MDYKQLDLHTAVVDGSYQDIEKCIEEGQGCKQPNENGWTPIHLAAMRARNDADDVIDLLIKHGADVNVCGNADDSTPLHMAVRYTELARAEAIILKLLENGADPDIRDRSLRRPYDYALERNYIDLATLLAGEQPMEHVIRELKKQKEKYYGEKLIRAVIDGDEEWLSVAVKKANVDHVNQYGACAIHYAVTHCPLKKEEVIKTLIDSNGNVNVQTYEKDTALNLVIKTAALREDDQMYLLVGKLLEWGTDITLQDLDGKDAVSLAEDRSYSDIVSLLKSNSRRPPTIHEPEEMIKIDEQHMLDYEQDRLSPINENQDMSQEESSQFQINLFSSILEESLDAVKEALQEDISLEDYNEDGYKVIHLAILRKDNTDKEEIIKELLKNGCDPNGITVTGKKTALHIAAEKNDLKAVSVLLKNAVGIDRSLKNQSGKTAYDIAASKKPVNDELVRLLAPPDAAPPEEEQTNAHEQPKKKNSTCAVM